MGCPIRFCFEFSTIDAEYPDQRFLALSCEAEHGDLVCYDIHDQLDFRAAIEAVGEVSCDEAHDALT